MTYPSLPPLAHLNRELREETDAITIAVDHRENADELVAELRRAGCSVVFEQLRFGDYRIQPDTIVERKTVDDFCLSIIDGRLFRQAYLLAAHVHRPIILVE